MGINPATTMIALKNRLRQIGLQGICIYKSRLNLRQAQVSKPLPQTIVAS